MNTPADTWRQSLAGLRVLLLLTLLLGLAYPLLMVGFGQLVLHDQANGSRVRADGRDVGSSLIGQEFTGAQWFHPRPSAASYDALASAGSNLGPNNPDLLAAVTKAQRQVAARNDVAVADVPASAVTSSGSGLDPHISPAYADLQVARVARARGLSVDQVQELVDTHTQGRILGFLGEPRVNVLELNLALAQE